MEQNKKPAVLDGDYYIFECPHCNELASVHRLATNCCVFRHGSFFQELPHLPLVDGKPQYMPTEPINPHTPKEICDRLVAEKKILGCAKPFRFVYVNNGNDGNYVEKCEYI